ncbi:MAG: hypothetical protein ACYCZZ_00775 [Minisyncoccota bacterium]
MKWAILSFVASFAAIAQGPGFADESRTSQNKKWLRGREIMGHNFFGVEEAAEHLGVMPSKKQLAALAEIPFTEEVLMSVKDTHILIAVFPVSIIKMRLKSGINDLFYNQRWYAKKMFAKSKGKIGWQLVRKDLVDDSTSKTWEEQQELLGGNEEMPSAQVMVYAIIGHFLATGERLFETVYVRTSSHAYVGHFDTDGLIIEDDSVNRRCHNVGLASLRNSEPV